MKKALLTATALLLTATTLLLTRLWLQRLALPYNEQGRHFDAAHSVVYDESAITVYGMGTALFALVAAASLFWAWRVWWR